MRVVKGDCCKDIFRDEEGFTTVAMALSLLIALALVFTGAQVYRVNTAAAQVQEVADAAVLSAENQVAEFMVVAQFCDATLLSLSLTAMTTAGLGLVALCVPPAAPLSAKLIQASKTVLDARNSFARKASDTLDKLQKTLPFLSAACAAAVARANNDTSAGSRFLAAAVLVPSKGQPLSVSNGDAARDFLDELEEESERIRQKAQQAEEAAQKANEAKQRAFMADCGNNPSRCMHERAAHLAGMGGAENPSFGSVDTWSFSVALQRAKTYYRHRLDNEAPDGAGVDAQARSALRRVFYRYAVDQMAGAYVIEDGDHFEAHFPHLPKNTDEMRQTPLYYDPIYPITSMAEVGEEGLAGEGAQGEGVEVHRLVMHAWAGCPQAATVEGHGSIAQMEAGGFETCPLCEFKASSLGKVAAASTSIDTGFEYFYEIVATEAATYQQERLKGEEPRQEVKSGVDSLGGRIADLMKAFAQERIDPQPPGRYGAIAFVVDAGTTTSGGGLGSAFVGFSGELGPRAAVSGATLLRDSHAEQEGRTVVNSLLDGLRQDGGAVVGAAGLVLDAWSFLLTAYADGQNALLSGIDTTLNALPLASASGLGSWASGKVQGLISDVGLQPAELKPRKAVLVNSKRVAERDAGRFGRTYVNVTQRLVTGSSEATDLFSLVLGLSEQEALDRVERLGDTIEIASIELLGDDGPSLPIVIPLPDQAKEFGVSTIKDIFSRLRSLHGEVSQIRVWK